MLCIQLCANSIRQQITQTGLNRLAPTGTKTGKNRNGDVRLAADVNLTWMSMTDRIGRGYLVNVLKHSWWKGGHLCPCLEHREQGASALVKINAAFVR